MRCTITLLLIMGLFSKLFGQTAEKKTDVADEPGLRLEYNVMKNISLETLKRYDNPRRYKLVEEGIYIDLKEEGDDKYRMTLSYELEKDETNNQYPLEDILDKYLMYVSDFLKSKNKPGSNKYIYEFGGYLDKMIEAKEIIGKKVFNRDFKDDDGQTRVKLVIE